MMFLQQAQIVIRRMKNELATVEDIEQQIEIDGRERVYEFIAVGGTDLNEADFFGIGMKAVGFGIERKPLSSSEFRQQRREFYIIINHVSASLANGWPKEKTSRLHSNDFDRQPRANGVS
jgi:hypothetical protein